ncbi:MAG: hypothetical protein Q4F72_09195, partial [Desulfovibrionaceae bacterium]|nr:hypothetical protein [Desulfovibrionaceae bacterium]
DKNQNGSQSRNPKGRKGSARPVHFTAVTPGRGTGGVTGSIDIVTCPVQLLTIADWVDDHAGSREEARAFEIHRNLDSETACAAAEAELAGLQKRGSVLAAFLLGRMLMDGLHGEQDEARGRALLEKAADRGFGAACLELFGRGVRALGPNMSAEAVLDHMEWLSKGLELKDPGCAIMYGQSCLNGSIQDPEMMLGELLAALESPALRGNWQCLEMVFRLLLQNPSNDRPLAANALQTLKKLAERDFAPAQCLFGELYRTGFQVRKSDAQAIKWLKKAWQQKDSRAGLLLAEMLVDEEPEGKKRAQCLDILNALCAEGNGRAHALVARLLGQDSASDWREIAAQYGKAIELGCPDEAVPAGWAFCMGSPDREMRKAGLELLTRAAECNPAGLEIPIPDGPISEEERASILKRISFRQAAAPGRPVNGEALTRLARLRLNGMDGRPADTAEGMALLEKAAGQECAMAMGELAGILFEGLYGVPADAEKAEEWARKGWNFGNPRCGALLQAHDLINYDDGCDDGDEEDEEDDESLEDLYRAMADLHRLINLDDPYYILHSAVTERVMEALDEGDDADEDEDEEEDRDDADNLREDRDEDEEEWDDWDDDDEDEWDDDEDDIVLDGSEEAMDNAREMGAMMAGIYRDGLMHLDLALLAELARCFDGFDQLPEGGSASAGFLEKVGLAEGIPCAILAAFCRESMASPERAIQDGGRMLAALMPKKRRGRPKTKK